MLHGQVASDDAVAAAHTLQVLFNSLGGGVRFTQPRERIANGGVEGDIVAVVDGQVQRHGAVAAETAGDGFRDVTRSGVGLALPGVGTASSLVIVRLRIDGIHCHGHRDEGAAAVVLVNNGGIEGGVRSDMLVYSSFGFPIGVGIPVRRGGGLVREGDVARSTNTGVSDVAGSGGQRVDDDFDRRFRAHTLGVAVGDGSIVCGDSVHRPRHLETLTFILHFAVVPFYVVTGQLGNVELHAHAVVGANRGGRGRGDDRRGGNLVHRDGQRDKCAATTVAADGSGIESGIARDVLCGRDLIVAGSIGVPFYRVSGGGRQGDVACTANAHAVDTGIRGDCVDGGGHLCAGREASTLVLCAHVVVVCVRVYEVSRGEGSAVASF